jgi:NADPH:quinone reductase-like Zn-dependent oxidoreductase
MKAIVLETFGDIKNLKLKEIPIPVPHAGEIRIKVKAVGFNPVDYKIRQGAYEGKLPLVLGSDCSGVVDAVGTSVKAFSVGDEVMAMPFGPVSNGSYAEYLCLPWELAYKKPKMLSFEQAGVVPLSSLTAYRAVLAAPSAKKEDVAFIAGAGGGVGSFVIPMLKSLKVKAIYTVAGSPESAEYLQMNGIEKEHILIYKGLKLQQKVEKLLGMVRGRFFDATFDLVGSEMKQLCLELTRMSGHFTTTVPEQAHFPFPVWERGSLPINRNLSLHFVFVGAESFSGAPHFREIYQHHYKAIYDLIEKGMLPIPPIKNLGPLHPETVKEAHLLLEEGRVKGKLAMHVY